MSPWFFVPKPNAHARLRLFCFPYAGGSAAAFRDWPSFVDAQVEVVAVEPPGRRARYAEAAYRALGDMVDALTPEIEALLDLPAVFFGYSNGALIAFETARALQARGSSQLRHLIVAAKRAPQLKPLRGPVCSLPARQFLSALEEYGGIPAEVKTHPELLDMMLPCLRADFALSDHYRFVPSAPLSCGMSILGGADDPHVPVPDLAAWAVHSTGASQPRLFDGGHFFLHSHAREVGEEVRDVLRRALHASARAVDSCD